MPIPSVIDNQLRRCAKSGEDYQTLRALFEQQQARDDLRENETFHQAVIREAPVAIHVYDIDLDRVIFGNPAYEAQLGYSLDRVQVLEKDLIESIYHADDIALRRETNEMLRADQHGQVFINVFRIIRADGGMRWVAVREMVLNRHDDGTPHQIVSIAQDITEFQAATDALAASKEAMQRLIQQLPVGIQVFDTEGVCTDTNKTHLEIFGTEREALVGNFNIFGDKIAEETVVREAALRAVQGETSHLGDLVFDFSKADPRYNQTDKGIRIINVTIVPIFDEHGKVTSFVGVNIDLTERKQMEDELRQSQRQYRDLANSITDIFYALDHDMRYTFWNRATEQLTGIPAAEAIGKTIDELFPYIADSTTDRIFQEVMRSGETQTIELPLVVDDQERHFESTVYPSPNGINVLSRDVTERVLAQQQHNELQLQRDRRQLLASFIEKVSHEFRTPLATIGTSVYLMTRTQDEQKRQDRADQVQRQIERITNLVEMQSLLARLDSGIPLKMAPVDIDHLCEVLVARYPGEPRVIYTPRLNLPQLQGNMDMIDIALEQLLENARRYTDDDGEIHLRVGYDAQWLWVEVADNGVGIPAENHQDIYKAFWRADVAHTRPGFGLGLPIVQRIVRAHDGHIELESRVGEGSRFRLMFPQKS